VRELLHLHQSQAEAVRLAELQQLMQPVLHELSHALGYERAFVVLADADGGSLPGAVGDNIPYDLLDHFGHELTSDGLIARALQAGKPIRVDDALRGPEISEPRRAHFADLGLISFAAVPLPPISGVLVISKGRPVSEAEINELLPYAGRLVAATAELRASHRQGEVGERHAIEKEWLWWMVNSVQDPVILSDESNNVVVYNEHAERLFKAEAEESAGKRRAIELNNILLSAALSAFALAESETMSRELTLVDPIEGSELLYEVICRNATNLRTGDRGLVSVLKNVTDLRRASDELRRLLEDHEQTANEARQERDRLNLILVSVAEPIVVTGTEGEILLMNPPARRLVYGSTSGQHDQVSPILLANEAKLSSFLSQLRLEPAESRSGEIQLVDPEAGEPLTMSVRATEVKDERGQVTATVSVLHDLTKIRELERREIEKQLFESEKLAAVGRLAAAVAHEINNPLEAIQNSLYLLVSQTPQDDPNHRFLEIASKETQRVSNVIHQMLGFSRPPAAAEPVDVNQVAEDVLALLDRQLRQNGIQVHQDLDPALPAVRGSAEELSQVFLNLVINAQHAMANGGTLSLTTRLAGATDAEFASGSYVLIQVRDTGVGIADEQLPQIFEPFYSTKAASRGTGLGLWVTLGIVQNHGGQMQVRSRVGQGTMFTVALPVDGAR
jgi:PAS domain S-box-containing protein